MNRFTALSALLGTVCLVTGAVLIYRPLGFLVLGSLLLSLAFATSKRTK